MGTNYNARPIKAIENIAKRADEARDEIRSYSRNSSIELDDIIDEWAAMKTKECEDIHIGKSSAGWRFLFNHNNWKYYNNIAEMQKWLKDYKIVDEYNRECTQEEFWAKVLEKQSSPSALQKGSDKSWYITKDGYEFSTSTNFC